MKSLTIDSQTLCDGFRRRVQCSSSERAYMVKKDGKYEPVSWATLHEKVLGAFASLRKHGIQKGDRIALMAHTAPEWNIADISILCAGAVTVPIYPSNTPEDTFHILQNSGAKLLFLDDATQLEKAAQAFTTLGKPLPVVSFLPKPTSLPEGVSVEDFESFTRNPNTDENQAAFDASIDSVTADDLASIVYTSGTTGMPKGVVLTHNNFTCCLRYVIDEIEFTSDDQLLTFLPFAHILGRVESLAPIFCGIGMGFAENITTVAKNILELKPTILVSVPRIYEKIYTKILSEVANSPAPKQKIFAWADKVGREVAVMRSEKRPIPLPLMLKFKVADKLVLSKIREKLGGRIKLTASGGAPLARNICEFFHACGIKILEGYGLTETMGPIVVNHPENYRFGTVGTPIGDSEVRIAEDGEILLRGSIVSKEYFNNPEATRDSFVEGGWFRSGDIGEIDEKGFLKITDRKKELIVTAGGKNIAPQKIENALKLSPFVSNCMTYGDRKKYLVALVTLDEGAITSWAENNGVSYQNMEELTSAEQVVELVMDEIEKANKSLATYETIKKFKVLAHDWTPETGELTPSLKVKRKVVSERFKDEIEKLY